MAFYKLNNSIYNLTEKEINLSLLLDAIFNGISIHKNFNSKKCNCVFVLKILKNNLIFFMCEIYIRKNIYHYFTNIFILILIIIYILIFILFYH